MDTKNKTEATKKPFSSRRIQAHGLGIHLTDWSGSEPPIVMLHALGFTGRLFDPLARGLSPNHRVICPDLRGHGKTDHPPEGYQYPNLVKDIVALLQILQFSNIILVGHTWGADIAMNFAAHHPKRVQGLVLIDGGYRYRKANAPGQIQENITSKNEEVKPMQTYASVEEAIADAKKNLNVKWNEDIENALVDSLEVRRDKRVVFRLDDHRWSQIYKALWAYDPSPFLNSIQIPTLIVHPSGGDQKNPENALASFQARAAALLLAKGELVRIPEADNLSLLSNTEVISELKFFFKTILKPKTGPK